MAERSITGKGLRRNLVVLLVCLISAVLFNKMLPSWQSVKVDSIKPELFPVIVGDWVGHDTGIPNDVMKWLNPDAVLSRRYVNSAGDTVDFMVIAGSSMESFHDPHLCFPSQGFTIFSEDPIQYKVMSDHPVSAFELQFTNRSEGVHGRSIYWYRTPYGTTRSIGLLRVSLGASRLFGTFQKQGFFIRMISMAPIDQPLPQKSIDELTEAFFSVVQKKMPEIF